MLDDEERQAREKRLRFWRDGAKWRCAIPRDDMATRLGFDWKRYGIRGCGETMQAALDDAATVGIRLGTVTERERVRALMMEMHERDKHRHNYGNEPDHDGDNGKGWRLYCEGCGYVDNDHYAFAAVQPVWAMYGK